MTEPADLPEGVVACDDGVARCWWCVDDPLYVAYHDTEWGFSARGDRELFERLALESFQSGLSWLTILRKGEGFRAAFAGFDPEAAEMSNTVRAVRGHGEGPAAVLAPVRQERTVTQYMLSVWYPSDATPPEPDELERITRDVETIHRQLQDEGAWVFGGGLHDPSTATVVTTVGGRAVTTDGPFVESKEVLGGFSVIELEDLDAALRWAERMSEATTCPIEVRPFQRG